MVESDNITVKIAYIAMYKFLENEYKMTQSSDIGGLLGGISLLEDGSTADPAAWQDWLNAIKQASCENCDIRLNLMP